MLLNTIHLNSINTKFPVYIAKSQADFYGSCVLRLLLTHFNV